MLSSDLYRIAKIRKSPNKLITELWNYKQHYQIQLIKILYQKQIKISERRYSAVIACRSKFILCYVHNNLSFLSPRASYKLFKFFTRLNGKAIPHVLCVRCCWRFIKKCDIYDFHGRNSSSYSSDRYDAVMMFKSVVKFKFGN